MSRLICRLSLSGAAMPDVGAAPRLFNGDDDLYFNRDASR
jgi:hypothetical protein